MTLDQIPHYPDIAIPRTASGGREGAKLFARALMRCLPEDREETFNRIVTCYRELLDCTYPDVDAEKKDDAARRFADTITDEFTVLVLASVEVEGHA